MATRPDRAGGADVRPGPARQRGLVLIALLLMLMLVGIGALSAAEIWSTARKHEREVQLLWVGEQYRHAIESYWKTTPGPRKILPTSIDQLLNDDRFPNPVHHLRQAYLDPLQDGVELEPIVLNNALYGVHSTSKEVPLKRAMFPRQYERFASAEDYTQWQFVFQPPQRSSLLPAAPAVPFNPGALPGQTGRR